MFNYLSAARALKKQLSAAEQECRMWKERALSLESKLDKRSDFFIEREFKLIDRFLTSQAKTYAITDEIRTQITETDVKNAALDVFLDEKRAQLVEWARDAGHRDPERSADETYQQNYPAYVLEFEAN